jgi:glycerate kinase
MRIVIAPDKFKGSLSAGEVASAIAGGIHRALPHAIVEQIPLADGGEGTVQALVAATAGRLVAHRVTAPLPGTEVDATFGLLGDRHTAVVEMAAASGLHLLRPDQLNPEATTTYGTGELLLAARELGAHKIILGIGGSATTDGGAGCAQACGVTFSSETIELPRREGEAPSQEGEAPSERRVTTRAASLTGGHLVRHTLTVINKHHALEDIELLVACDVNNPLYGPDGAARVFGPQKGATPDQVKRLDAALARFAQSTGNEQLAHHPGAGAAGGLGFGLLAFLGARIVPGFDLIADTLRLRDRLRGADCVITGEGRLDASSLHGKTAIGVARLCNSLNIPCIAVTGSQDPDVAKDAQAQGLTAAHPIRTGSMTLEESLRNAAQLLTQVAEQLAHTLPR